MNITVWFKNRCKRSVTRENRSKYDDKGNKGQFDFQLLWAAFTRQNVVRQISDPVAWDWTQPCSWEAT